MRAEVTCALCLRARSAMPGTDFAYRAPSQVVARVGEAAAPGAIPMRCPRVMLRTRTIIRGTNEVSCYAPGTACPVLRESMPLPASREHMLALLEAEDAAPYANPGARSNAFNLGLRTVCTGDERVDAGWY
eukprot:1894999-Rhodomonas_salina.1